MTWSVVLRMMLRGGFLFFLVALFVVFFTLLGGASINGKPRLEVPSMTVENDLIVVTTRLKDAYSSELEQTLQAGKQIVLRFHVEVLRSRFSFLFPDECIWQDTITHSVIYNTATRKYTLTLTEGSQAVTRYTDNPHEMMKWIGYLSMPLPAAGNPKNGKKEHYLRIWAAANTKPLPGGFRTKTIYSKKFIPERLFAASQKKKEQE